MQLESYVDTPVVTGSNGGAWATLAADYTSGATSLAVSSNAPYGAADPTASPPTIIYVRIENELFLVTDNRTTTWTVAGAQQGSTAANHSGTGGTAKTVYQVLTKASLAALGVPMYSTRPYLPVFLGGNYTGLGHSYVAGSGSLTGSAGYVTRLGNMLGASATSVRGNAGYRMVDIVQNNVGITAWTGLVTLDGVINDVNDGSSTATTAGFTNSLRAMIDFLMSAVAANRIEESSGQVSFTGTWSTTAWTGGSGGNMKTTATLNDSMKIAWYGDKITIMLVGRNDSANGTAGAAYSVAVGGTTVTTGTLSNQINLGGTTHLGHVPVRLSGYGPGYHTATITKTDANGPVLAFDCAVTPATNPPTVVIVKGVPILSTYSGFSQTYLNTINGIIDTEVSAAFLSGQPLVVCDPTLDGSVTWAVNDHINQDGIHPSDRGHNVFVQAVIAKIQSLAYRWGLNSESLAMVPAAPTPVTGSDNFTRTDNAGSLGSTSTGSVPWQVENPAIGALWGIASNQAAPKASVAWCAATVETGKADTTVTWTIAATSSTGLVFRVASYTSMLLIFGGSVYTGGNGSWTSIGTAPTFAAGDVIQAVLSGNSITFKKNGSTTGSVTSSYNQTATRHGILANSETTSRWSAFSWT